MKNLTIYIVLLLMTAVPLAGQNVPEKVRQQFEKDFPGVYDVDWDKEDYFYEVEFKKDGMEYEVVYDQDGKMNLMTREIHLEDVPTGIVKVIRDTYPDSEIDEVEERTTSSGVRYYEFELDRHVIKDKKVVIDENGNIIDEERDIFR